MKFHSAKDLLRAPVKDRGVKYPSLRAKLLQLMEEDRVDRDKITTFSSKALQLLEKKDQERTLQLNKILDEIKGEPSQENIGMGGSRAVWLLSQHSDLKTMERVLKSFKKLEREKKAFFHFGIPFLVDRIAILTGQRQIFGTQKYVNDQGVETIFPVDSPAEVNVMRKKYNLAPVKDLGK